MPALPKITTSNNWTQVYHVLKQSIVQRKFRPNEKIAIPELAEQLGVSPTPIRDALNRLEAEGLIRTVPKVGTFVSPLDEKQAADTIETRLMLEYWVAGKWAGLAADNRRETIERMAALVRQASELLTPALLETYRQTDLDREFHLAFIRAGNNERNVDIYDAAMNFQLFKLTSGMVTLDQYQASWQQHGAIVEALSAGDAGRMQDAIRTHLDSSRRNLLHYLNESGGQL